MWGFQAWILYTPFGLFYTVCICIHISRYVVFREGNLTLPHKLAQLYWYSKNYVPPSTPMLKSTTPYTYPNMVRFGNPSQRAYPAVCLSSNAPSAQSTRVRSGNMQDYKELLL